MTSKYVSTLVCHKLLFVDFIVIFDLAVAYAVALATKTCSCPCYKVKHR